MLFCSLAAEVTTACPFLHAPATVSASALLLILPVAASTPPQRICAMKYCSFLKFMICVSLSTSMPRVGVCTLPTFNTLPPYSTVKAVFRSVPQASLPAACKGLTDTDSHNRCPALDLQSCHGLRFSIEEIHSRFMGLLQPAIS